MERNMPETTTEQNEGVKTPDQVLDEIFGQQEPPERPPEQTEARASAEPGVKPDDAARANPELRTHLEILKRDGVPDRVLEHFASKDPDQIKEWAEKARKRQSAVDSLGNRLRDALASSKQNAGRPAAETDIRSSKHIELLKDLFGDDAADAIVQSLSSTTAQATTQADQAFRLAEQARLEQLATTAALRVVAERGLAIGDVARLQSAMSEVGKANPGAFNTVDEIAQAAAEKLWGPSPVHSASSSMRNDAGRRTMTRDEQIDLIAELCLQGLDADEARRRAGLEPLD